MLLHQAPLITALVSALIVVLSSFSIQDRLLAATTPSAEFYPGQHAALKRFIQLAEQNQPTAQYNLGLIYEEGNGVPPDLTQAINWYSKAADQGNIRAQYKLGYLYYFGPEAIQNPPLAMQWFHRAADQNDANAIYRLGIIHSNPDHPEPNLPLAISYLEDAARAGHSGAQLKLGQILQEKGLQQNLLKSYIWLSLASERGNREALFALESTRNQLDHSEINLAQRATDEIYQTIYEAQPSQTDYFGARDIEISNALVLTINWLYSQNINLQQDQLPEIKLLQKNELVRAALQIESQKGGMADEISILASYRSYENVPLRALYDGKNKVVLMPTDWQYNSVTGQAELIHELVHHHQVISGKADRVACTGTLEKQAMRLQNAYLQSHNLPITFSDTDIMLMGDCDE